MKTASLTFFLLGSLAMAAEEPVEQWGLFELSLPGPTNGNPFTEIRFSAEFVQDAGSATTKVAGFYDGEGIIGRVSCRSRRGAGAISRRAAPRS